MKTRKLPLELSPGALVHQDQTQSGTIKRKR